jgi:hypothetical protein
MAFRQRGTQRTIRTVLETPRKFVIPYEIRALAMSVFNLIDDSDCPDFQRWLHKASILWDCPLTVMCEDPCNVIVEFGDMTGVGMHQIMSVSVAKAFDMIRLQIVCLLEPRLSGNIPETSGLCVMDYTSVDVHKVRFLLDSFYDWPNSKDQYPYLQEDTIAELNKQLMYDLVNTTSQTYVPENRDERKVDRCVLDNLYMSSLVASARIDWNDYDSQLFEKLDETMSDSPVKGPLYMAIKEDVLYLLILSDRAEWAEQWSKMDMCDCECTPMYHSGSYLGMWQDRVITPNLATNGCLMLYRRNNRFVLWLPCPDRYEAKVNELEKMDLSRVDVYKSFNHIGHAECGHLTENNENKS